MRTLTTLDNTAESTSVLFRKICFHIFKERATPTKPNLTAPHLYYRMSKIGKALIQVGSYSQLSHIIPPGLSLSALAACYRKTPSETDCTYVHFISPQWMLNAWPLTANGAEHLNHYIIVLHKKWQTKLDVYHTEGQCLLPTDRAFRYFKFQTMFIKVAVLQFFQCSLHHSRGLVLHESITHRQRFTWVLRISLWGYGGSKNLPTGFEMLQWQLSCQVNTHKYYGKCEAAQQIYC